jgi:hypothetical protein
MSNKYIKVLGLKFTLMKKKMKFELNTPFHEGKKVRVSTTTI